MKKVLLFSLMFMLLVSIKVEAKDIGIIIDGREIQFTESSGAPFGDQNQRTQVPLRVTMENCGAKVDWNQSTQTATVEKDGILVEVPMNANYIYVNRYYKEIDTQSVVVNNRIYLPIRFVLEAFGAQVDWDGANRNVVITQSFTNFTEDDSSIYKFSKNITLNEEFTTRGLGVDVSSGSTLVHYNYAMARELNNCGVKIYDVNVEKVDKFNALSFVLYNTNKESIDLYIPLSVKGNTYDINIENLKSKEFIKIVLITTLDGEMHVCTADPSIKQCNAIISEKTSSETTARINNSNVTKLNYYVYKSLKIPEAVPYFRDMTYDFYDSMENAGIEISNFVINYDKKKKTATISYDVRNLKSNSINVGVESCFKKKEIEIGNDVTVILNMSPYDKVTVTSKPFQLYDIDNDSYYEYNICSYDIYDLSSNSYGKKLVSTVDTQLIFTSMDDSVYNSYEILQSATSLALIGNLYNATFTAPNIEMMKILTDIIGLRLDSIKTIDVSDLKYYNEQLKSKLKYAYSLSGSTLTQLADLSEDICDEFDTLKRQTNNSLNKTYSKTLSNVSVEKMKILESISASCKNDSYFLLQEVEDDDFTVTAKYSDGTSKKVSIYTVDSSKVDITRKGAQTVTISYTENGVTKTALCSVYYIDILKENEGMNKVYDDMLYYLKIADNYSAQAFNSSYLAKEYAANADASLEQAYIAGKGHKYVTAGNGYLEKANVYFDKALFLLKNRNEVIPPVEADRMTYYVNFNALTIGVMEYCEKAQIQYLKFLGEDTSKYDNIDWKIAID